DRTGVEARAPTDPTQQADWSTPTFLLQRQTFSALLIGHLPAWWPNIPCQWPHVLGPDLNCYESVDWTNHSWSGRVLLRFAACAADLTVQIVHPRKGAGANQPKSGGHAVAVMRPRWTAVARPIQNN